MNHTKHLLAGFIFGLVIATAPACGPARQCNPTTCPSGCCDSSGTCQTSSQSTCGQLGQACQSCQVGQVCNLGVCQSSSGNGGGFGTTGGGSGTTGGGDGTTGGGDGTTGGGDGTTGGGDGTTGGGAGTTGGGAGTTGGGAGTTGGGAGTTGGGAGTTGGGAGTTGGGAGTTGGGSGSCDGCIYPGVGCINFNNSNTPTICGRDGATCAECSGSTPVCDQTSRTCVASGTGGGTGTNQPIGGTCTSSANCASGLTCKTTTVEGNATYPGGYCTRSCTSSTDCGGGVCVVEGSILTFYGEPNSFCTAPCTSAGSQSTCRSGYRCTFGQTGSAGGCWLDPFPAITGGTPNKVGDPCTTDSQCQLPPRAELGSCIPQTSSSGSTGFTNGYCVAECTYDVHGDFCGANAQCIGFEGATSSPDDDYSLCLRNCSVPGTFSNCRSGYTCINVGTATGVCYPSCTVTGCSTGTCNSSTGQCQ